MALRKAYDIRRRIFTAGSGRDMAVGRDTMSRPFCGGKTFGSFGVIVYSIPFLESAAAPG